MRSTRAQAALVATVVEVCSSAEFVQPLDADDELVALLAKALDLRWRRQIPPSCGY